MSTAFYPTNMRAMPAGGTNHKSTLENIPYVSWKGKGIFKNPIGITATHIRPLTNLDPGNIFPTGFGLPRPLKHYRKGTVIPIHFNSINDSTNLASYTEQKLIEYNVNRAVKSSFGSSLGGGNGGTGLISQLIDNPGGFIVKENAPNVNDNLNNLTYEGLTDIDNQKKLGNSLEHVDLVKDCETCNGVGLISSWAPITNLTEKPEQNVTNPPLCCNQQRKAIQRVLPTNTNVKKNYYQTTYMYLYNRCQTFQQRQFNFVSGPIEKSILSLFLKYPFITAKIIEYSKPGDPLSIANFYVAQCNPNFTIETASEIVFVQLISKILLQNKFISLDVYNSLVGNSISNFITKLQEVLSLEQYKILIEYFYQIAANPYNGSILSGPTNPKGCAQVYYKPNNPQFAQQGAVSSSTRLLKLQVDTISKNSISTGRLAGSGIVASQVTGASHPFTPFIYKDKTNLGCQRQTYTGNPFFFQGQHQNKLICKGQTNGSEYHTYNTVSNGSAGNYIGATQNAGQ
jgi:hypothetical protein